MTEQDVKNAASMSGTVADFCAVARQSFGIQLTLAEARGLLSEAGIELEG